MPVDFARTTEGELGRKQFVSDLLASAVQQQFTGSVAVADDQDRQLSILFREGRPVHAAGTLAPDFRLGELLMRKGSAQRSQIASALTQLESLVGAKPLSGALLVKEGLDPDEVKRAVQEQTRLRIRSVFGLTAGLWKVAPGENARMREVGVRSDPVPMLLEDLPQTISDRELKWAADQWLGRSVQIRAGGPGPLFQSNLDPALPTVLRYLEKPRKPDQVERAVGNRRVVRLALRLLELLGRLEGHPMGKAVPIPKATLLKGQGFSGYGTGSLPATEDAPAAPPPEKAPPREPEQPLDPEMKALFEEIRRRHREMAEQNHFEVLGVGQEAKSAEVRQAFTALAQRLHPDKLGSRLSEEAATVARELFARLNEANRVLGSDEARAAYMALLGDHRIRGDARRADLVRDAETKAQMGVVLLRKREFQKAREMFAYCVEADPVTPSYKAQLAFAMYADRKFDRDEAFEKGYALLLEALQGAGEGDAMVHHYTGLLLKERNRNKEALHHFQQAARIAPKNVEHKREVRLLEGRLAKDQKDDGKKQQTGGLGRFFKR